MKILTWNCNGALRKKYHTLDEFDADILIIQECENPELSTKLYQKWAGEYFWIGNNKNKGLGVFAKKSNTIRLLDWSDKYHLWKNEKLESFLPIIINDKINLIALWTKQANSEVFGYIGQLWKYLQLHKNKFENIPIIIAGDFNSNSIWDKWDRWWNHTDVVSELKDLNIKSLYHEIYQEEHGKESIPTFYMHKKIEKPYHIDYIFLSSDFMNDNQKSIFIGDPSYWLSFSDHMPLVSSFKANKFEEANEKP